MLRYHSIYSSGVVRLEICDLTEQILTQNSLTTWLSHSKKKTCDVCKHPYAFTKGEYILIRIAYALTIFPVYAADMPPRLPPVLLARRLVQQAIFALLISVRAVLVGMVWLAMLPWATVWTWRICFTIGELTYVLSDAERPYAYFLLLAEHGTSVTEHQHPKATT